MATTPDFGTPLVAASQGQPEITHNEGLRRCEVLAAGIAQAALSVPAGTEIDGDVVIVDGVGTGDFDGQDNKIAFKWGGSWRFIPDVDSTGEDLPIGARHAGLRFYVQGESATWEWSGTAWAAV